MEAQRDRIQGVVRLDAIIETDGAIEHVDVVQSVPGLDDAAEMAVRDWEYEPMLLNGEPVSRLRMTITVSFTLT